MLHGLESEPLGETYRLQDVVTGLLTVNVRLLLAVCPKASFTCVLNVSVTAALGVPDIAPEVERLRPFGREPDVTDHVYGEVPPVALSCAL